MSSGRTEWFFERGLEALTVGSVAKASTLFQKALAAERSRGVVGRDMRYLSYYAFAEAKLHGVTSETIRLCEDAAERDIEPQLVLNLVQVYLMAGLKTKALASLETGLRHNPGDRRFLALRTRIDRRRKPTVRYLSRDHAVNRLLGRLLR